MKFTAVFDGNRVKIATCVALVFATMIPVLASADAILISENRNVGLNGIVSEVQCGDQFDYPADIGPWASNVADEFQASCIYGDYGSGRHSASQVSDVEAFANAFSGFGVVQSYVETFNDEIPNEFQSESVAGSFCEFSFLLTDPHAYVFSGTLTRSSSGGSSDIVAVYASLDGVASFADGGSFSASGLLQPGRYDFLAYAYSDILSGGPGLNSNQSAASFDFALTFTPVPEPATWLLLSIGAIGLLKRFARRAI